MRHRKKAAQEMLQEEAACSHPATLPSASRLLAGHLLKSLGGLCFVVVAGANYLTTHPLNYKISIEDPDCTRNIK